MNLIFEKEKRIDLILKDFFFIFSYNPLTLNFINQEEKTKIQNSNFFKDLKNLIKALSSFNYFFKNQLNKIQKFNPDIKEIKINKPLIFISFLLAYNELINIKLIDIPKFENILGNKKKIDNLKNNWLMIFDYTNTKINSKILKKIIKNLIEKENFNKIEIFILLLFLVIKSRSFNKYLVKKVFKKKYINKLFITGDFLNSIAKYYYNVNLDTTILKELLKEINYLYLINKIRTINQVIRYVKKCIKKILENK